MTDTNTTDTEPTGDFRLDEDRDTPQLHRSGVDPENKPADWRLEDREPTVSLTGIQPVNGTEWRAPVQELQQQQEQAERSQRLEAKPNKTDNKSAWERYASDLGIDTHGMNKEEIQDAVENKLSDTK